MSADSLTTAYIGLGANLDEPAEQLRRALAQIDTAPEIALQRQSSFYRSAALTLSGRSEEQADYCNAVVEIRTALTAPALFAFLQGIEQAMGRVRGPERWAPRRIDLDLLLYGNQVVALPTLTVPHPEMHKRDFVIMPLLEIAPRARIPGIGLAASVAQKLAGDGLALWEQGA